MRQLAAVLFADITGYSQMMHNDEGQALHAITQFRSLTKPIINRFGGIWHKDLGDGVMCSFKSALQAVESAVEIQKILAKEVDFQVRIGIHLGDIVFDDNDILGDGVNLAARIQAEALPGSICISHNLFQSIRNRSEFGFTKFGKRKLKGFEEPILLYHIPKSKGDEKSHPIFASQSQQLDRPLILVLPFDNLSPQGENEYFSDGLTDELITELSQIKGIQVIARSSSMKLKDTKQDLLTLASQLNCSFILQGSVRRAVKNLRISAQLVDAIANTILWADRYKGTPEDIFDFQEEVARSIVNALNVKLSHQEEKALSSRPFSNLMAYDYYLRARRHIFSFREEDLQEAEEDLSKGQSLVGDNPLLLYGLGMVEFQRMNAGISAEPSRSLEKLKSYSDQLLRIAPESHLGNILLGVTYAHGYGNLLEAIPPLIKAYKTDSQNPDNMVWLGVGLMSTGQLSISREIVENLALVDPLQPLSHLLVGYHTFFRGEPKEGLKALERSLAIDPHVTVSIWAAIRMYAATGYLEKAKEQLDQLKKLVPESPFTESAQLFFASVSGNFEYLEKPLSNELTSWAGRDGEWGQILVDTYGLAGMVDEALHWLTICSKAGFINHPFLVKFDPFLDPVKDDPSFQRALDEIERTWRQFNDRVTSLFHS